MYLTHLKRDAELLQVHTKPNEIYKYSAENEANVDEREKGKKFNRQHCMALTKSLVKIFYTKFYKIKSVDLLKNKNARNTHQTEDKEFRYSSTSSAAKTREKKISQIHIETASHKWNVKSIQNGGARDDKATKKHSATKIIYIISNRRENM